MKILDMPFDESQNSRVAYDFGPQQNHGKVVGATFENGVVGNAIQTHGQGYVKTRNTYIDLTGDFTVVFWAKAVQDPNSATLEGYQFLFAMDPSMIEVFEHHQVNLNQWVPFAMVKSGLSVKIYKDLQVIGTLTLPNHPVEWAVTTKDQATSGFSYTFPFNFSSQQAAPYFQGLIDELQIYDEALNDQQLTAIYTGSDKKVWYLVDGIKFEDYEVYVSNSSGVVDALVLKEPVQVDWAGAHGVMIDVERPRYKERKLSLECFIHARSMLDFGIKMGNFIRLFQSPGLHRLYIGIHEYRPLVYEVYAPTSWDMKKKWNNKEMFGTFTLPLVESLPIKKVLRFIPSVSQPTVKISCKATQPIHIFWDDRTSNMDILHPTSQLMSHTYAPSEYGKVKEIIISGAIEAIQNFSTNAIVIWNRL